MRALDKIMLIHEPGTGKIRAVYQALRNTRIDLIHLGAPIKKVYVLVKNRTLQDEFYMH